MASKTTPAPTPYSASSPSIPPPPPSPGRQRTISSLRSPRIQSSPILLQPLPPTSSLNKESVYASELELDKQTRQIHKERQLQEALQEQLFSAERLKIKEEQGTWSAIQQDNLKGRNDGRGRGRNDSWGHSRGFTHPPQAFELYKAIDQHDIDYIMRIRDHNFGLLLQKNGNEFPILYATRLGERWRDVVILLVGALSRYVNHLDPEDFEKKETLRTLKALRANLKLAIDHTLLHLPPGHSPTLLSSYLQVLIMSEGDSFLYKSIHEISLLLRSASHEGVGVQPVKEAESIIRKFCTKELRGVKGGVGDVEEYIANATLDLVIMAGWSLAVPGIAEGELLPTHTFARDLRTYSTFMEHLETNLTSINKLNPRVRKILFTLRDLAGESKKSVRGRLKDVQAALDGQD